MTTKFTLEDKIFLRFFKILLFAWFGGVVSALFHTSERLTWPNFLGMFLGAALGAWFVYLEWKKEKLAIPLTIVLKAIPPDIKASDAVVGETYRITELPILWEADYPMKVGDLILRTDKGFWCWRWKKTIRADNDNLRLKPWLQKEIS